MLRFEIIINFKKIMDSRGLGDKIILSTILNQITFFNYIPSRLVSVSFYVHVLIVHVFEYS